MFDYTRLLTRIAQVYGGTEGIPEALGISMYAFMNKLNNKSQFKQGEILTLVNALEIKKEDIYDYFFTQKV